MHNKYRWIFGLGLGLVWVFAALGCDADSGRGLPSYDDGYDDYNNNANSGNNDIGNNNNANNNNSNNNNNAYDTGSVPPPVNNDDVVVVTSGVVGRHGTLQARNGKIIDKNGQVAQLRGLSMFWSNWAEGRIFYTPGVVQTLANTWHAGAVRAALAVGPEANGYASDNDGVKQLNLERVETIIDAAIQNNIYVLVDFHTHFADDYIHLAHEFFGHISQKYGRYPHIIYEIWNEPLLNGATSANKLSPDNPNGWTQIIKPYAEQVIATIRQNDSRNLVLVGTRDWSKRVDEVIGNEVQDVNVAYVQHYYIGLHDILERNWGQAAIDAGIPVFISEWGLAIDAYIDKNLSSGVRPEAYNIWPSYIRDNQLCSIAWSVTHKNEPSATLAPTAAQKPDGNWTSADVLGWGQWLQSFNAEMH